MHFPSRQASATNYRSSLCLTESNRYFFIVYEIHIDTLLLVLNYKYTAVKVFKANIVYLDFPFSLRYPNCFCAQNFTFFMYVTVNNYEKNCHHNIKTNPFGRNCYDMIVEVTKMERNPSHRNAVKRARLETSMI